jgi:N-methylhydantoinase B/oxoprolinase/acetone carboxylase alpha subunit
MPGWLALGRLPAGEHSFTDYLELVDGTSIPIVVRLTIHGADRQPAATIDFTGTGPVIKGNLNANRAIVTTAVIYTPRLLIPEDISLNHGTVRRLEFLRSLEVSLLTQRRGPHPPYGAAGGQPGALGRNHLIRPDGTRIELPGITQFRVEPGDVLVIETPGGGGYGQPNR